MVAVPLLWAFASAFKDNREILEDPWGLPGRLRWANFAHAWSRAHLGQYLLNTAIVVGLGVLLTMLLGSMMAYVLARYDFVGNRVIYYLMVSGIAFPVFLALVPLFFVVSNLHLLNTYQGLIMVYVAYSLPFTVFFMYAFFRTLPTSIAEAAIIDGCSHDALFFRVMLPMARPGLISVGIFNVLGQWNQFLLPTTLMQQTGPTDPARKMLSQALADLAVQQGYAGDWGALFAGLTLATLPVLAVYLVFQRQVQAGLTAGTLR
ncbi:MAG TPA: carbohydrate ABC transporter permease [Rugosimonospora sp.]|nr:carbohydrate ABC transporter permease [Rugosimonospora sp.]